MADSKTPTHTAAVGGFTGYVYLAPLGTQPPLSEPQRPAQPSDDEGEI
jgi:hypothetical protein